MCEYVNNCMMNSKIIPINIIGIHQYQIWFSHDLVSVNSAIQWIFERCSLIRSIKSKENKRNKESKRERLGVLCNNVKNQRKNSK